MDERLTALIEGQNSVAIIEGEAGIGKSRLLADWLEAAPQAALQTFMGAGDAIEQSTPYHAWRSIFSQLFQWDTLPKEREGRLERVLAQLQPLGLQERAPLLNVVLPIDLPDNELTFEMTGKVRADNTHALLVALLQTAASAHPLRIIIEDAHWLDSASWALAQAIIGQVQSLLFTLVTRPLSTSIPAEYQAFLITREVAYNLLLFAQRRQLHQAVAEWYEQAFASDLAQFYPLLAHHWSIASEHAQHNTVILKAIEYLEKAGEVALRDYANREAVEYFNKLLKIVSQENAQSYHVSVLRLALWEQQLGEAHNRLGHLDECEQHFGQSLQYLGWPLPKATGGLVRAVIRQLARQARTRLQPPDKGKHTELSAEALEARRLASKISERLGLLYFIKNPKRRALGALERLPRPDRRRGDSAATALPLWLRHDRPPGLDLP